MIYKVNRSSFAESVQYKVMDEKDTQGYIVKCGEGYNIYDAITEQKLLSIVPTGTDSYEVKASIGKIIGEIKKENDLVFEGISGKIKLIGNTNDFSLIYQNKTIGTISYGENCILKIYEEKFTTISVGMSMLIKA